MISVLITLLLQAGIVATVVFILGLCTRRREQSVAGANAVTSEPPLLPPPVDLVEQLPKPQSVPSTPNLSDNKEPGSPNEMGSRKVRDGSVKRATKPTTPNAITPENGKSSKKVVKRTKTAEGTKTKGDRNRTNDTQIVSLSKTVLSMAGAPNTTTATTAGGARNSPKMKDGDKKGPRRKASRPGPRISKSVAVSPEDENSDEDDTLRFVKSIND